MGCQVMGQRPTFILMMLLTTTFFLVEIIVGYVTNSVALIADSFHMLSDIISLFVGFFALKLSRKTKGDLVSGNTFGWVRAEVLGALINAVFLVALCLSIFISALKRLVETEPLTQPILILIVGVVGLVVNLLGMILFHGHAGGHGHSHGGGHGHSHGGGGHGHSHGGGHGGNAKKRRVDVRSIENIPAQQEKQDEEQEQQQQQQQQQQLHTATKIDNTLMPPITLKCPPSSPSMRRFQERARKIEVIYHPEVSSSGIEIVPVEVAKDKYKSKSEGQLNMRGVYLHILGDALGSVIVIVAALIVQFVKQKWTMYVDPGLSIIMVAIILYSSVPLLKESSQILLQNVPAHIQLNQLEDRLLNAFPEIIGIHEFHVWQLAGSKIIASVHVKFNSNSDYTRLSPNLKEFFHSEGIHSTTFQPEVIKEEEEGQQSDQKCLLACPSKSCQEKLCCSSDPIDKEVEGSSDEKTHIPGRCDVVDDIAIVVDGCDNASGHDNASFYRKETLSTRKEEEDESSDNFSCDGVSTKNGNDETVTDTFVNDV